MWWFVGVEWCFSFCCEGSGGEGFVVVVGLVVLGGFYGLG